MTVKPKLLLVDDDPDIHNFIQHELSDSPFDLFSAYSAQEAIDLLGNHHFTMGLIDIVLGTTETSEKLIQFFKEDLAGRNQHLPMAIMSAHMDEAYGRKIRLKGPTVFAALKKPLRPKQILKLLTGSSTSSVLVINPDFQNLRDLKTEFEKSDLQVFTCLKLDQAQGLLESTQFIAIVVDQRIASETEFAEFIDRNKNHFNLPYVVTGAGADSSLMDNEDAMFFDFIEDPLSDSSLLNALEKVKRWQESDEEDEKILSSVTASLKEEVIQVKGLEESLTDETRVSGGEIEGDSSQVIGGDAEDLGEESIRVEGSREEEDRTSTTIKGEREDVGEEFWSVKNIGHEEIDSEDGEFDPNQRNDQGITPLMATCYLGELKKVQALIKSGGDPRLRAKNGKTLVHFAAFSGNPELVEFLAKEKGLKINERDSEKREPMFDAIKGDNAEVVQVLLDLGARHTLKIEGKSYLNLATQRGSAVIMEKFLALGLSPEERDYDGKNCLDYIQKMGRKDLAEVVKKHLK